ncbi:MAG: hypothetical protein ACQESB_02915 [Elusimicrobiota bacterium]
MKKFIVFMVIVLIGAFLYQRLELQEPLSDYSKRTVESLKNSKLLKTTLDKMKIDVPGAEDEDEKESSEGDKKQSGESEQVEYAPAINLQGVIRADGNLSAIIDNDLYQEGDFVRNNRIVEINPDYIILQGRTRRFRYNLN